MSPIVDAEFDGFEWDEDKSALTLAYRGIDFISAARIFDGFLIEREDTRREYGEQRIITTGEAQGLLITVVWTPRARHRRITTAWPASDQERRAYHEHRALHKG